MKKFTQSWNVEKTLEYCFRLSDIQVVDERSLHQAKENLKLLKELEINVKSDIKTLSFLDKKIIKHIDLLASKFSE